MTSAQQVIFEMTVKCTEALAEHPKEKSKINRYLKMLDVMAEKLGPYGKILKPTDLDRIDLVKMGLESITVNQRKYTVRIVADNVDIKFKKAFAKDVLTQIKDTIALHDNCQVFIDFQK